MASDSRNPSEANLHKNHRKRLFARYDRDGFDTFEEHNILELLLFYSITRADTNPTAHNLINRFGSLYGVLTAPEEELKQVKGIGPTSARLLHEVFDGVRSASVRKICERPVDNYDRLQRLASEWMAGRETGTSALILFGVDRRVLDIVPLASGHVITPFSYTDTILELANKRKSASVVLMHNHPDADLHPSAADRCMTADIYRALDAQGIRLMEHLVVHEFDTLPILDISLGEECSAFPRNYLK